MKMTTLRNVKNIGQVEAVIEVLIKNLKVESILCYGSYATGLQDDKSDVDLLVIVQDLPKASVLQKIYKSIPDSKDVHLKDFSHWDSSSWSQLNASFEIRGLQIEIGYNTKKWVQKVVRNLVQKKKISFKELPFRSYTFLGLLEQSQCLYDKRLFIKKLRAEIRPFPAQLKKEIVKSFLPILRDCHENLIENLNRDIGILTYQFYIFLALDAIVQLIWVINDAYDPATKRTEAHLFKLKNLPKNFVSFIENDLPNSYTNKTTFIRSLEKIKISIEKSLKSLNIPCSGDDSNNE